MAPRRSDRALGRGPGGDAALARRPAGARPEHPVAAHHDRERVPRAGRGRHGVAQGPLGAGGPVGPGGVAGPLPGGRGGVRRRPRPAPAPVEPAATGGAAAGRGGLPRRGGHERRGRGVPAVALRALRRGRASGATGPLSGRAGHGVAHPAGDPPRPRRTSGAREPPADRRRPGGPGTALWPLGGRRLVCTLHGSLYTLFTLLLGGLSVAFLAPLDAVVLLPVFIVVGFSVRRAWSDESDFDWTSRLRPRGSRGGMLDLYMRYVGLPMLGALYGGLFGLAVAANGVGGDATGPAPGGVGGGGSRSAPRHPAVPDLVVRDPHRRPGLAGRAAVHPVPGLRGTARLTRCGWAASSTGRTRAGCCGWTGTPTASGTRSSSSTCGGRTGGPPSSPRAWPRRRPRCGRARRWRPGGRRGRGG